MGSWDHFYDWETWLRWGISDNFFDTGVDNSIPGTITSEGGSRILGVWLPSDYQGGSLPLWVWSELMRGRLPIDRDLQCTFALDQRLSWWQSVSCTSSSSSSSSTSDQRPSWWWSVHQQWMKEGRGVEQHGGLSVPGWIINGGAGQHWGGHRGQAELPPRNPTGTCDLTCPMHQYPPLLMVTFEQGNKKAKMTLFGLSIGKFRTQEACQLFLIKI